MRRSDHVAVIRRYIVAVFVFSIVGTFLVLLSPLLIKDMIGSRATWDDVGNIGQAYDGAAALLSALAFIGIAVSVGLQWQSMRVQQTAISRERHFELLKMAIENPQLVDFGMPAVSTQLASVYRYANLWMSHWAWLWEIGELDELGLRSLLSSSFFTDERARSWWELCLNNGGWGRDRGKKNVPFSAIVTQEYDRSMSGLSPDRQSPQATGASVEPGTEIPAGPGRQ